MKTLTESEHRLIKAAKEARARAGITYPPEMLPEAEDPETAIVVVFPDGIRFQ